MIIKIKSSNTKLLDVLHKNPNTDQGLYLCPLKKGVIVGHVINEFQYDILFQDTKYSYLPEESNLLDFQSHCSPLVVLDILRAMFQHLLKEEASYKSSTIKWLDTSYGEIDCTNCSIEVPAFYIHSSWVKGEDFLLSKYFSQVSIKKDTGRVFSLRIDASNIFQVINLLSIVSVFCHMTNNYGTRTFITDSFAEKYARILTNVQNVPYFVFYLFIKRGIKTREQFAIVKPIFEKYLLTQGLTSNLTYLPTHQARIDFILKRVDFNKPVLDIGCGELKYYKALRKNNFYEEFIAVDKDEKFEHLVERTKAERKDNKLIFNTDLEQVEKNKVFNIILSEVIEHNSEEVALTLVKSILKYSFNQLIITTPNVEFNKYYSETLEKRHDDHDFEFNTKEFQQFINSAMKDYPNFIVEYEFIGDTINNCQPTQVAIIKPVKIAS